VQLICNQMSENFDPETRLLQRLDRIAKIKILGIRDLYKPGHHPRHRPPTVDAALKRYEIAQLVAIVRAVHPDWQEKEIRYRVCKYCGIERAYYYRALKEIEPQRWRDLEAFAAVIAEQFVAAT
jgi:ribosomal protein L32